MLVLFFIPVVVIALLLGRALYVKFFHKSVLPDVTDQELQAEGLDEYNSREVLNPPGPRYL